MLAPRRGRREWGLCLLVSCLLTLSGCGGNIKDLLKDTPAQEGQEQQ
jgi:hypothetical protein